MREISEEYSNVGDFTEKVKCRFIINARYALPILGNWNA